MNLITKRTVAGVMAFAMVCAAVAPADSVIGQISPMSGITVYAEAPDTSSWPTSMSHTGCGHPSAEHFYSSGTTYSKWGSSFVEGRLFSPDSADGEDCYNGSETNIMASVFTSGTSVGWYYKDGSSRKPCEAITYTVTFDMNGHGLAPTPIADISSGNTITAPTAPTAEGYTFDGWYKEAGCINAWDFATDTVTDNTTLYAKWTDNNATTIGAIISEYDTDDVCFALKYIWAQKHDLTCTHADYLTWAMTTAGWNANTSVSGLSKENYTTSDVLWGDTGDGDEMIAFLQKEHRADDENSSVCGYCGKAMSTTYTVHFNANGGTGEMADVTDASTGYTVPTCTFTAPAGKVFDYWAIGSATGDKITTETIDVTAETTLYAVWKDAGSTTYTVDDPDSIPDTVMTQTMSNTDGTKNVRFVKKISVDDAKSHKAMALTVSNGSGKTTVSIDKCYSSIKATVNGVADTTVSAGDGYVFVAFTFANVPADVTLTAEGTDWVALD